MRYTFQMPVKETVEFQARIQREMARRIMPRWVTTFVGYGYYIAVLVAGFAISGDPKVAFGMMTAVAILYLIMQRSYTALYRKWMIAYLQRQPESETWTIEIAGGYLCAENRGVRTCFSLPMLTGTKEENGLLLFRFGERGAVRLPVSVFSTGGAKDAFIAAAKENQPGTVEPCRNGISQN